MDILNPPKSYIDWRCTIHDWENNPNNTKEQFDSIRKKFYEKKEYEGCENEILEFCRWLHKARNEMSLPIEGVAIREDGIKTRQICRMMIYDIYYWRKEGKLWWQKQYIPLEPIQSCPRYKGNVDLKSLASGEHEPGEDG